jgi:hypothetical protein
MKKKELIKINRTKLVPKLVLAILLFSLIAGFTVSSVAAHRRNPRSNKLNFGCIETQTIFSPYEMNPVGDKVVMKAYKESIFSDGKIDGIEFTGGTELDLTIIIDPATGEYLSYGPVTMFIYWDGLSGSFSGYVIAKGVLGVSSEGLFALRGAGDFEGMTLFGKVLAIDASLGINKLSGIIFR